MLTQVDRRDGHIVFKVTNLKGSTLCYRVFPENAIGDSSKAREFPTLQLARNELTPIPHPAIHTKPKLEHPQNQPGYKAPRK